MLKAALSGALLSFVLGVGLKLLAERIARGVGIVARPAADRWHRTVVPLLGGVAIVMAMWVHW